MTQLKISNDLSLPTDAVTQKMAFLARTGAGKTYAAMKLCELMLDAGAQVVALDPVGVWYGLRLAADGKGKGFTIPVFGGEHGDLPLEPKAGALIADLIVDRAISAVLDVSMFESKSQHKQFATDFAERLFFRKKASRSPLHLFFEEAQEFVPQFKSKGEERMLGAFERLIKLGRNYGIGASLISQRPQAVNKDVLNQTECLFALQTTGPQERKAIEGWIAEKGISDDIASLLPKLAIGEARVWSPQWLGISKTVKIAPKKTYDASATPVFGAKAIQPKTLTPVDVEEIRRAMAETVERAEANDPVKLKRQIAELQKKLTEAQKNLPRAVAEAATKVERVEVPVLKPQDFERAEKLIEKMMALTENLDEKAVRVMGAMQQMHIRITDEAVQLRKAIDRGRNDKPRGIPFLGTARIDTGEKKEPASTRATVSQIERKKPQPANDSSLGKGERIVLTAIAQHGEEGVTREQLTVLTGYKRSTRDAYIQRLGQQGYTALRDDHVVATDEGISALGPDFEPLPTGEALQRYWLERLSGGEKFIFASCVEAYPKAISREDLSEITGYARSSRDAYIQRLAARKLVIPESHGNVRASAILFD